MILSKPVKAILSVAALISALGAISVPIVWAADQRYWNVSDQQSFEKRQLERDIKRLELKVEAGNASAEDRAYLRFLLEELDALND